MPNNPDSRHAIHDLESQISVDRLAPSQRALVPILYIIVIAINLLMAWLFAQITSSTAHMPEETRAELSKTIDLVMTIDSSLITGVLGFLTGKSYALKIDKE
jgi:hypothetical protein